MTDEPAETAARRLEAQLMQQELPFLEDARALERYIRTRNLSQAECARRLGRSQAAVANRLRLLKLPEDVADALTAGGLTERHARALLRLPDRQRQRQVLGLVLSHGWKVAKTEEYVDSIISGENDPADPFAPLLHALRELRSRVPEVEFSLEEEPDVILFEIRLPREKESEKY